MLQLATILTLKSTLKSKVAIRIFRLLNGIDDVNDLSIQKRLKAITRARIPLPKLSWFACLGNSKIAHWLEAQRLRGGVARIDDVIF